MSYIPDTTMADRFAPNTLGGRTLKTLRGAVDYDLVSPQEYAAIKSEMLQSGVSSKLRTRLSEVFLQYSAATQRDANAVDVASTQKALQEVEQEAAGLLPERNAIVDEAIQAQNAEMAASERGDMHGFMDYMADLEQKDAMTQADAISASLKRKPEDAGHALAA